jgi:4-hydroxy-tetrahydrodipicolinate synthase
MKPLNASEIAGTYATLLLPIQSDDSIDFSRLNDQLDYLIHSGVDGIYSNGTAGEFYTLSNAEFVRLSEVLANKCEAAGMTFQLGAGFPTPQISLERARQTALLHPGAIQVILPDWYPLTIPEAISFLNRIAEATAPVPLVLYNPPHAKRVLAPEDYQVLCPLVPALVGIKVGGGDEDWYRRMGALTKRLSIFVPGHSLATGYARGAAGSYSNVACLQPTGAKRWNELMKGDWAAAKEEEDRIQSFMTAHILPFRDDQGFSNMALDKLLASIGNWAPIDTRLRWPYAGVGEAEVDRLRRLAREEIPFLFENAFV